MQMVALAVATTPLTGCSYNTFVSQEQAIKAQWAQVESQLQRRNDLIPNLVETTKGFAQHEEAVYKDIADARSRLLAAKSPGRNDCGGEPADPPHSDACWRWSKTTRSSNRTSSSTG